VVGCLRGFVIRDSAVVEDLRLGQAQKRLSARGMTIEGIAAPVGFRSADAFRRAFERRFGITPTNYWRQFPRKRGRGAT
jgi:transcriptional regulator GlxA family with amidase domain